MSWYLVRVITRQERLAKASLAKKGYHVYCPFIYRDRRGHSQWQTVALWPGYMFVWLDVGVDQFPGVLRTPAVIGFCFFGDDEERRYGIIGNDQIDYLKSREDRYGIHGNRNLDYQSGDAIETTDDSPYRHYHGIVQKSEGERLQVLLQIAEYQRVVTIDKKYIRPYHA